MYIRNPDCTCKIFTDIDTLPFTERRNIPSFWKEGFIYTPEGSIECECHKKFRLSKRYDVVATQVGLPTYNQLKQLQYIGEGNAYNKLKSIPNILKNHARIQDVIVFCSGVAGNQKTTSAAKLMYNLISDGDSVEYILFQELIQKFLTPDYKPTQYEIADWLILDNCFSTETINFKNTYNSFYNLLAKRHAPTILITDMSRDQILSNKQAPYYNELQLNNIFKKIDRHKTTILFEDNVDKIQFLGQEPIDLWSLGEEDAISK